MKAIFRLVSLRGKYNRHLTARSLRLLTLLLIFLASTTLGAIPQSSAPESSTAVWDKYFVDAPSYFYALTDRTLRFNSEGLACMAFGGDSLYYSCYDKENNTWNYELVDASSTAGSHAALAFNDQDRPYISYYDSGSEDLMLAFRDFAGIWNIQTMDESLGMPAPSAPSEQDSADLSLNAFKLPIFSAPELQEADGSPWVSAGPPGIGKYTSIDIDSLNAIHISYYDDFSVTGGQLKYAYWDGWSPTPSTSVVQSYHDQGKVGLWTSIAVDSNRQPHISYMSEKYDTLMYAKKSGGDFDIEEVERRASGVGTYSSIALDTQDRPHISYFDFQAQSLRHAYRQTNGEWLLNLVDSSDAVGYFTSIAISDENKIFISYYDATNGKLMLATTNFGNWNGWTKSTVAKEGDVGYYTSIALWNDQPSVFYFDLTEGYLKYSYWRPSDDNWRTRTLSRYYVGDVGLATSLVISNAGVPHISYMDDSRDFLKFAKTEAMDWETSFVTEDVHAGSWSSIDMLNNNRPAIAFYDMSNYELKLAFWNGTKWVISVVDSVGNVGSYVSMKIDSARNYHISYYDASLARLKYAFKENGEEDWEITVLDRGGVGRFTSLALDEFDRPYISYYDDRNEDIKVIFKSITDTWVDLTVASVGNPDDDDTVNQAQSSIAVLGFLPDIRIHISYYNQTDKSLRYAYYEAGVWSKRELDQTAGNIGKYNSLAIDPVTENRHICYHDASRGNLKYAFWDGSWSYEDVDMAGKVGSYCSLDLNSAGEPAISYYDATGHNLKYATTFPLTDEILNELYIPLVIR